MMMESISYPLLLCLVVCALLPSSASGLVSKGRSKAFEGLQEYLTREVETDTPRANLAAAKALAFSQEPGFLDDNVVKAAKIYVDLATERRCNEKTLESILKILRANPDILSPDEREEARLDRLDSLLRRLLLRLVPRCRIYLENKYKSLVRPIRREYRHGEVLVPGRDRSITGENSGSVVLRMIRKTPEALEEFERLVESKDVDRLREFLATFKEKHILEPCNRYKQAIEDWQYQSSRFKDYAAALVGGTRLEDYLRVYDQCSVYNLDGTMDSIIDDIVKSAE